MAATENINGTTIELTVIDADWIMDGKEKIQSIIFVSGEASANVISLRDGPVDTAPHFLEITSDTEVEKVWYGDGISKQVYVDFDECTLTAGHKLIINLWPAKR